MEDRKKEDQIWGEVRRRKMEDRNMQDQLLEWKMQDQIITRGRTCRSVSQLLSKQYNDDTAQDKATMLPDDDNAATETCEVCLLLRQTMSMTGTMATTTTTSTATVSTATDCYFYCCDWIQHRAKIKYKITLLTFRVLHGSAPLYLGSLVPRIP